MLCFIQVGHIGIRWDNRTHFRTKYTDDDCSQVRLICFQRGLCKRLQQLTQKHKKYLKRAITLRMAILVNISAVLVYLYS